MLVHEPCAPGERIDESQPLAPKWAYPKSKAAAEEVIRREHGRIPCVLLHLAGVYDEKTCVPAHQIARIYERDFKSYVYSGGPRAGQSVVHKDDMVAEARALGVQHAARPLAISFRGVLEARAPPAQRHQLEIHELAARVVELREAHHAEVAAELLVTRDAFVVVDEAGDNGSFRMTRPGSLR